MYITQSTIWLGNRDRTIIPCGATAIRYEEFLYGQMMAAIQILAKEMPREETEIEYTTLGKKCVAILDGHQTLYIWEEQYISRDMAAGYTNT